MNTSSAFPSLDNSGDEDRELLGSKAATLQLLVSRGFRVPPGFVVTAAAVSELGDDLDAALQAAADRTGAGPFAVRSSAVAEDLPDASYAGMYETSLNVDRGGLAESVRRGFASASDERVVSYSSAHRLPGDTEPSPSEMAMLVQQMIDPIAAGVAFTANPLTGRRDETIVTAVRGLAESLVSGESTGEQWTIQGGKATCTRGGDGVLDEHLAREVAKLARRVEGEFGTPQDIEWALDDQRVLYLLQARPMTAVPDPVDWAPPGPGLWSRNFRIGEWLPEAMTPLFADWILPALESGYLDGMKADVRVVVPFRYASVNGWYYNATPIPSPRVLWHVLADSRGRAPWFLYNALVRVSRNPAAADHAVLHDLETRWRDVLLPAHRDLVTAAEEEVQEASIDRVVQIVNEICRSTGMYLWSLSIVGGSAWKMEGALAKFWRMNLAAALKGTPYESGGHQTLLRGLPGAGPAFAAHAVYSLDWIHPTAGETSFSDGAGPLGVRVAPARSAALVADRLDCEEACRAALQRRPGLRARFEGILAVAQHYAALREEQARDLSIGWPVLRQCARRLGGYLRDAAAIDEPDDVFFLTLDEVLDSTSDHTQSARDRRAMWSRQRRLFAPLTLGTPPRLIGDPIARAVEAVRSTRDLPEGAIIGHPASAGRATGRVRLVTGPEDFASFRNGEVLVAKATAPAWTPLFARAVAVVTDGGTLAAHASLVAREYGIPAVVGTGDATMRLHDGQLVTVDGSAGAVLPIRLGEES